MDLVSIEEWEMTLDGCTCSCCCTCGCGFPIIKQITAASTSSTNGSQVFAVDQVRG